MAMIYRTRAYRVFTVFNIAFMLIICVVILFPYVNVLAKSLNESKDTMLGGLTVYPRKPTLENYQILLSDPTLIRSLWVSIARVASGTILALLVQYSAAYAFSQRRLVGRTGFLLYLVIPMFFSGGLIPTYILYARISLLNSFWVYILPTAFSMFNMVIIRTYLYTIPDSLTEAAKMEGAGHGRIVLHIMIPLSMPIIATITLWMAVAHWNDWVTTLYFVTKPKLHTLQYILMQMIRETDRIIKMIQYALMEGIESKANVPTTPEALKAAQVIVTTLPIIMVYPFLQRYFIKGIMIGSVKG